MGLATLVQAILEFTMIDDMLDRKQIIKDARGPIQWEIIQVFRGTTTAAAALNLDMRFRQSLLHY
jgi:phage-related protein